MPLRLMPAYVFAYASHCPVLAHTTQDVIELHKRLETIHSTDSLVTRTCHLRDASVQTREMMNVTCQQI
jgi:hypothetical protein